MRSLPASHPRGGVRPEAYAEPNRPSFHQGDPCRIEQLFRRLGVDALHAFDQAGASPQAASLNWLPTARP